MLYFAAADAAFLMFALRFNLLNKSLGNCEVFLQYLLKFVPNNKCALRWHYPRRVSRNNH